MMLPDPRSLRVPNVRKQIFHCHGYTATQGSGQPWTCPVCQKIHGVPEPLPRAHRIRLVAGAPRTQ